MKKYSVLAAAALLALSTGIASAQARHHRLPANSSGELSSTNVLDAAGPIGYGAPHEVPENGGAASIVQPGSSRN
jgi:hypothetical protein